MALTVLSGALGVPCTRNPLMRGLIPRPRMNAFRAAPGNVDDEGRVLRSGAP